MIRPKRLIQVGTVLIGKGSPYLFTGIEGLSAGEVSKREETYYDTDGAEYFDTLFRPREITIKGCIFADNLEDLLSLKKELERQINPKENIECIYHDYYEDYRFIAIPSSTAEFGSKVEFGRKIDFIIYLTVPGYYIESYEETITELYSVQALLTRSTVLPAMFSRRVHRSNVINGGVADTYPTLIITCEQPNTTDIKIMNHTVGKSLVLDRRMTVGETITVDMYNCTVVSSVAGNIINSIDVINNFWALCVGVNDVEVQTNNIAVSMHHRDKFAGV